MLHTTAYHPMSNSMVERMNNTLITRMRMYVEKDQLDWDLHVPFTKFAANICNIVALLFQLTLL